VKVFGFAGYSGAGKTTLIERLIPRFVALGWRVALVKHAHHRFDLDQPGKDSWRHRQAGAFEVLLSSSKRWALMHELGDAAEPSLAEQVARLSPCELVLVEGYKHAPIPKLEVHRPSLGHPTLHDRDDWIVGVAANAPVAADVPVLDLDHPADIAAFIVEYLRRDDVRPAFAV
jgi:molybdopterin-guanine dinucleotide biosynthesis protein B